MRPPRVRLLESVLTVIVIGMGCGGGSSLSNGTGRAVVKITWPDRSRLIPVASNSIKVVFTRGAQVVDSQLIPRPVSGNQTQTTFTNLKTGSLTLTATALPNSDGSGVAQATGTTPVTISSGQTTAVTLTMASTINHLEISPQNPNVSVGSSLQLTVTAKDLSGSVVMISETKLQWVSSAPAVISVDAFGKVTASSASSAQITVTETESGMSASTLVTGTPNAQNIYVTSFEEGAVKVYDGSTGAFIKDLVPPGRGGLTKPHDMLFDNTGLLYVSADTTNDVKLFNSTTGAYISTFVANGSGGLFNGTGLARAADGNLLVGSAWTNDVKKYDNNTGAYLGSFLNGNGLDVPTQMIYGKDGKLYVTSTGIGSGVSEIKRFDPSTGAFIDNFVSAGSGGLSRPVGIVFGPDDNLYIASYLTNGIKRYNGVSGAFIDDFVPTGSGGLISPGSVMFGGDGRLYVASNGTNSIKRYNGTTGAYIDDFIPAGSGGLNGPSVIVFRPAP